MSGHPPMRAMRANPDLEQLKRQAKELHASFRAGVADAVREVEFYRRDALAATFALHDAQFVLARSYGFASWAKLKAAVDGVTAGKLHEAAERGDVAAARALLERRPEIVDLGRGEMRALHMAVLRRDLEMTRLLLDHGADPHSGIWPNRDATSAYQIARDRGYDDVAMLITEAMERRGQRGPRGPNAITRKLVAAFQTGSEAAVVAVYDEHPELAEMCPADGVTLLHQQASRRALLMMKWLIDHGADVNRKSQLRFAMFDATVATSPDGFTPIEFAALGQPSPDGMSGVWQFDRVSYEHAAQLLLDHGAELGPLSAATLGRWDWLSRRSKHELERRGVLEAAVKGNQLDVLRRLLDLGLDPNERMQVGPIEEQSWSAGGPLFQAVILNRIEMARLLLERGADPNVGVWAAGSPAFRAYEGGNEAMIALIERHGGWIDAASAASARRVDLVRKMLAGESDAHIEPNDFSGRTVAEQVLWGGASSRSAEIVLLALAHIDWPPDDARWFWMLWRPLPGHEDLTPQQQADACAAFAPILARCGPQHRSSDYGQTMLHEVIARDHGVGAALATMLLDAGARLDVRDRLLESTPLGWACRWGRTEIVKLLLARGADPIEADAPPWATPRAWATTMRRPEVVALLDEAR